MLRCLHGCVTLCLLLLAGTGLCPAQVAEVSETVAAGGAEVQFTDEPVLGEVDVRAQVAIPEQWQWEQRARIVFAYRDEAAFLHLDISRRALTLGKVQDGRPSVLASRDTPEALLVPGVHHITIKRRSWSVRVLVDDRALLWASDDFSPGDRIGHLSLGLPVEDLYAQPIGEMMFHDDFSRPPDEPGPWQPLVGEWKISLPETRNNKPEAAKSANPFSFVGRGEQALAVVEGSPHWDNYRAQVAARASDGAVGLAFYCRDKENHYLLRATTNAATEGAVGGTIGVLELVKVVAGEETVLSVEPLAFRPGRWYRLWVRVCEGLLSGGVDGAELCRARDDTFSQGNIGLYARGCREAHFDDVSLEPYRWFEDDYEDDAAARPLDVLTGTWRTHRGWLRGSVGAGSRQAIALLGCSQWRDYTFRAHILPANARAVGLYFGCMGPQDYLLFRWGRSLQDPDEQRQELWRVASGAAELVAGRAAPLTGDPHEVEVTTDRGYVSVAVDGRTVLEGADVGRGVPTARRGRVGYHVEGAGSNAEFDNFRLRFCEPPREPASITEQFAKEDTMADWARPAASWDKAADNLHNYSLPVWGDFDLRIRPGKLAPSSRTWSVGLRLAATPEALTEAPVSMSVGATAGQAGVACGDGPPVVSADDDPLLELERRGGVLVASLDGTPFAGTVVPPGAEAPIVGLQIDGQPIDLNSVQLTSPHIVDETFSGAPTDWAPTVGTWTISDRWNCQPQWAWFCGREADSPLIWHKTPYSGDMVAEFWAAVMMDRTDGNGYSHPSDLNGIICGDGTHLCSGYAFVFAGENNTSTRLMREGEVVAETDALKIGTKDEFHRHWFHCRLEKTGGHLTYYVDGNKALEYEDPQPLAGGHVGLWTYQGNGILVARARIAYQEGPGR